MGMPLIEMHLSLFDKENGGLSRKRSQDCVLWLMETLVRCNEQLLTEYDDIPDLYQAGVKYEREIDTEHWLDIRHVMEAGAGDCEDLACWRIAELRVRAGIRSGPYIKWRRNPETGGMIYHALCRWPDGRIEDPSLALGMRGEMSRRPVFVHP